MRKRFATGPYSTPAPNGWLNMLNIGQFGTDYQTRAYVAYMGLGANICDDIVYPTAFVDGAGKALDGAHQYVIHLTKEDMTFSSVGVWSFSAYRENFYVQNPIERYGLLPAMPTYNADGSLDVLLQADSPGPAKESNWLSIPRTGLFNVTLRIYNPVAAVLDPAFRIPPITRVR